MRTSESYREKRVRFFEGFQRTEIGVAHKQRIESSKNYRDERDILKQLNDVLVLLRAMSFFPVMMGMESSITQSEDYGTNCSSVLESTLNTYRRRGDVQPKDSNYLKPGAYIRKL